MQIFVFDNRKIESSNFNILSEPLKRPLNVHAAVHPNKRRQIGHPLISVNVSICKSHFVVNYF